MIELHAIIKGHVQGVGFRYTVQNYANQMGIFGVVRNLPDGSVELIAQGVQEILEKLLEKIREGPGVGRVDSLMIEYTEVKVPYHSFNIVY
ncbi:acylphosphatase [Parachlamydia sp. AcF125]|uniref:acylphosphatase n=1 Tax=Parachlamydia sp. AcF125 TaxID=2795736 RepID=UPI001BC9DB48|nr:acylphosphatase [Parachlamydia sp. AcF125]MBS4169047.1 Acylphosphatase [Parachlamydia sp. AcF125]